MEQLSTTAATNRSGRSERASPAAQSASDPTRQRVANRGGAASNLIPDPHRSSCGSIRQGIPLRRTNTMPARHARSDTRGRPPRGRRGGIGENGPIRSHKGSRSGAAAIPHSRYFADEYQLSEVLLRAPRVMTTTVRSSVQSSTPFGPAPSRARDMIALHTFPADRPSRTASRMTVRHGREGSSKASVTPSVTRVQTSLSTRSSCSSVYVDRASSPSGGPPTDSSWPTPPLRTCMPGGWPAFV